MLILGMVVSSSTKFVQMIARGLSLSFLHQCVIKVFLQQGLAENELLKFLF